MLTNENEDFYKTLLEQVSKAKPLVKLQEEKVTETLMLQIKDFLIKNGLKDAKINLQIFTFNPDEETEKKEGRASTSKGVVYYYTDYITS